jgi:excinuclease ABC subunit C
MALNPDPHPADPPELPLRPSAAFGVAAIEAALKTAPEAPGVYRMLGAKGEVLYVGKARSIKKRLASYARPERQSVRIHRMVALAAAVEVVTTRTEAEALLLEANLIKRLKPRYNILLRDDKSFPYLVIRGDHAWPQLVKHRGARKAESEHFGPFASAGAVNRTLTALQRAFPLRTCTDSNFATRTRPCLQYQIKRCTAPCVGLIGAEDYAAIVEEVRAVLRGKSREVQDALAQRMNEASEALDFEKAATLRDRIRALAHVQARQDVNLPALTQADVIALHLEGGAACVQVFFFRAGFNYGNRAYFPAHTRARDPADILAAFLGQFYQDKDVPRLVLLSHEPAEAALVEEALSIKTGRRVRLVVPKRGDRLRVVQHALANAREALARRLAEGAAQAEMLGALVRRFALPAPPRRIEIYDNSHIQGREAIGAMVVAGPEGFEKGQYRRFTIRSTQAGEATPGDDYAMMREVLTRRFQRLVKEAPERAGGTAWPDLVIIDGGAGQLAEAVAVLAGLGVEGVELLAIAKGPDRDAGRERFFRPEREPVRLPEREPVLFFLQRLRDEAHRFAIGGHRAKRARTMGTSPLDDIQGIGARRKRALLNRFGSARAVAEAGIEELATVEGISTTVAKRIHDHFHPADRAC